MNLMGRAKRIAKEANEIHMTHYRPGTVTLNDRTNRNGENARVFWQAAPPGWTPSLARQPTKW
jgi:hypothetical protein